MKQQQRGGAHLIQPEKTRAAHGAALKPAPEKRAKEKAVRPARERKKLKIGSIIAIAIALVLLAAVLALVIFVNSKLNLLNYSDGKSSGTLTEEDRVEVDVSGLEKWEAPKESMQELADEEGVFNILLLGTDGLETEYVDHARSDATLLLSLNMNDHSIHLTSFERGIGAPITSGEWEGKYDLITHIFAHGGADMMMQDIRECFKVNVERYVRVNFTALMDVIDVLGGVDVEITEQEAWYLNRLQKGESVGAYLNHGYIRKQVPGPEHEFVVGMNHLTGSMALAYSRLRAIDDDWHRIQRQRTVLQACADGLKSADIQTFNTLADEILPLVQTNLTKREITSLIFNAPGFLGVEFEQLTIPEEGSYGGMTGLYGADMLAVDFEHNSKLLHDFIYGD